MTQPWSYSSIKTFDQCAKKYYHLRVAKDYVDEGSEATHYGNEVHAAAEAFFKTGTPIPEKYAVIRPSAEAMAVRPGIKHAELKLGVRKDGDTFRPCGFFDAGVWWRGIVDLLLVNGRRAMMIDWKTGKSARYADTKQLDLMAGAVFAHFPDVEKIASALAFVVSGEFVPKVHVRERQADYMGVFDTQLARLAAAHENDVWNASPSGLCGWCPVLECPHHRPRR